MADNGKNLECGCGQGDDDYVSPQKRKAEDEESPVSKKVTKVEPLAAPVNKGPISISLSKKPGGISMKLGAGPKKMPASPIKMSLGAQPQKTKEVQVKPKSDKVASVFNEESDSEEEEMPFEAKMRMRNVGRETPTAAGPNSFGKGNLGFCDRTKMIERDLKKQMDDMEKSEKSVKT